MTSRAFRVAALALLLPLALVPRGASAQGPTAPPRDDRGFRLLSWNVSDSAWVHHLAETQAVLRHADADVFAFLQVPDGMDAASVRRILSGLRGPADTTWFVSVHPADASAEHAVIASRDSIREIPEFALVEIADTGRLATLGAWPDSARFRGIYATRAATRSNAASVRVHGAWVLVTAVHLTCCGSAGDWREPRRQAEAVAIRKRLDDVEARVKPDAVVIAGDMNLVSGRAAMDTLLDSGRRSPLGPMRRADALHFDGWTDWTWDGRGSPFNGGRLDNVLYSAGALAPRHAWIWDTESLPADTLRAHQLSAEASKTIGRHRPVVVDFSLARRARGGVRAHRGAN